jgi:hypothetical protein
MTPITVLTANATDMAMMSASSGGSSPEGIPVPPRGFSLGMPGTPAGHPKCGRRVGSIGRIP